MLRDVGESRRVTAGIHKHFGDTDIQACALHVHCMCIACALHVLHEHCMCIALDTDIQAGRTGLGWAGTLRPPATPLQPHALQAAAPLCTSGCTSKHARIPLPPHARQNPPGTPLPPPSHQVVDVTIVSRTCWPALPAETFELPSTVREQLDRYEKQFLHAKARSQYA